MVDALCYSKIPNSDGRTVHCIARADCIREMDLTVAMDFSKLRPVVLSSSLSHTQNDIGHTAAVRRTILYPHGASSRQFIEYIYMYIVEGNQCVYCVCVSANIKTKQTVIENIARYTIIIINNRFTSHIKPIDNTYSI